MLQFSIHNEEKIATFAKILRKEPKRLRQKVY